MTQHDTKFEGIRKSRCYGIFSYDLPTTPYVELLVLASNKVIAIDFSPDQSSLVSITPLYSSGLYNWCTRHDQPWITIALTDF